VLEAADSTSTGAGTGGGSGSGTSGGASPSGNAGATGSAGGTGSASSAGGNSATGGSSNAKTKVVTAETLALDQANIDVAQAGLDSTQQALASANLVSTISGTVGAVTLAVGSAVSAGSASAGGQVVVLGSGASYDVVATVPVTAISKVAIGQQAFVTPDSSNSAVPGTVTGIGVLATSGSTSTTYPVTVSMESSSLGLSSGGEAGVGIVTGKAVGVTTVPTSAVQTVGTTHFVTVVDGTATKQVKVTTGTAGAVLTQIESGVSPGQQVSLATIAQPVPSSSTTSTRTGIAGLGGTSGFPGGGAGGFTGGGARGGATGT
jgi:multidrug efflux pump subunit AcrA (membrane-fusion protein)